MPTRQDIVACARRHLDIRFLHQGRGRDGLDCLGLLLVTAAEAGLAFERQPVMALDVPTYGLRPDSLLLRQKLERFLLPIAIDAVLPADIVLLKISGLPQHLAILSDYPMAGELGMIHAYAPARKVVEHRYDPQWRRDSYAAYRLPQLV